MTKYKIYTDNNAPKRLHSFHSFGYKRVDRAYLISGRDIDISVNYMSVKCKVFEYMYFEYISILSPFFMGDSTSTNQITSCKNSRTSENSKTKIFYWQYVNLEPKEFDSKSNILQTIQRN